MFGIGFTRELERTIATRDNTIKLMNERRVALEDKLHAESLKVVRLAAENATLKQRINNLESDLIKASEVCSSFAVQYEVLEKEIRAYKVLEANMNKTISPRVTDPLFWKEKDYEKPTSRISFLKPLSKEQMDDINEKLSYMEKPKVHPNLLAYYNRGKNKSKNK